MHRYGRGVTICVTDSGRVFEIAIYCAFCLPSKLEVECFKFRGAGFAWHN